MCSQECLQAGPPTLNIHYTAPTWKHMKTLHWFTCSICFSWLDYLKLIHHMIKNRSSPPPECPSLNILRPRVRSSTGCRRMARSSCCAQGGVPGPAGTRRAGHWCADGCRRRSRGRWCTLAPRQASRPGDRKMGQRAGGSWSSPPAGWLFPRHKSPNTERTAGGEKGREVGAWHQNGCLNS